MREVKIFRIINQYIHDDYDSYLHSVLREGVSDWEEISDEDFEFIRDNLTRLNFKNGDQLIIVEKIDDGVPNTIKGIKDVINKSIAEAKAREDELKRKKERAAEQRAMKKLERDRKALERLIKENPDLVKELK